MSIMATSYAGPATLRVGAAAYSVQVHLSTSVGYAYSWEGHATTADLAALDARGGILTLPDGRAGEVYVPVTELNPDGGVRLRLHGVGRAPYELDGDIVTTTSAGGATVYEKATP